MIPGRSLVPISSGVRVAAAHRAVGTQVGVPSSLLGSAVLLGLLEGSRFAKDVIPFMTGVRLAAAQQILVGVVLVALMIRRPEGLLPEKPGSA